VKVPRSSRPSPIADTARDVLDIAERLVQTRGYNGFSYADIAAELSVTKASLHYHFPTKAALGRAILTRYSKAFAEALATIDAEESSAAAKLARYAGLYAAVLRDERMCLCGMLAAEYATLPRAMQEEIRRFFALNEAWLVKVLQAGVRAGAVDLRGTAPESARMVIGTLEGAMLVARSYGGLASFEATARRLMDGLIVERIAPRRGSSRAARKSA
jgi:TetR/AcrR family transcriptional repressor of nem operon